MKVEQPIYFDHYPDSQALLKIKRGPWWEEQYKPDIQRSVGQAITESKLDIPWEEIHADPEKARFADALFDATLSCYGPRMTQEMHKTLLRQFLGDKLNEYISRYTTTANHEAVAIQMFAVDSNGNPIKKVLITSMNMPTFPTRSDGKPTIGDISPISLSQKKYPP